MKLYKFYKNHFRGLIEETPQWIINTKNVLKSTMIHIGRFLKILIKVAIKIIQQIFVVTGYILIHLGWTFTGEQRRADDMYYLMETWYK